MKSLIRLLADLGVQINHQLEGKKSPANIMARGMALAELRANGNLIGHENNRLRDFASGCFHPLLFIVFFLLRSFQHLGKAVQLVYLQAVPAGCSSCLTMPEQRYWIHCCLGGGCWRYCCWNCVVCWMMKMSYCCGRLKCHLMVQR